MRRSTNTAAMPGPTTLVTAVIFLLQTSCSADGDGQQRDIGSLLRILRNASSKYEAELDFEAFLLRTNVTQVKQLRAEDSRGQVANYIVNFDNFLYRVPEHELQEIANLTGNPMAILEYLRKSVSGHNLDEGMEVKYMLHDLRNEKDSLTLALGLMAGVDYLNNRNIINVSQVIHLSKVEVAEFYEDMRLILYEIFSHAPESHMLEVAEITDDSQVGHIIALRAHDIHQDMEGLLEILRTSTSHAEAKVALMWFSFGRNFAKSLQLRRKDKAKFDNEFAIKLSDLLTEAQESDLYEIIELSGLILPGDTSLLHSIFIKNENIQENLEDLLTKMRNSASQEDAEAILSAYLGIFDIARILGTADADLQAEAWKEDQRGRLVRYAVNFVRLLFMAPENKIREIAALTKLQYLQFVQYIRQFILDQNQNGTDNQLDLEFLISEDAEGMLNVALIIKTVVDFVSFLDYDISKQDLKITKLNNISQDDVLFFFFNELKFNSYELFSQADNRQLQEALKITNNTHVKHIIALREFDIEQDVKGIIRVLQNATNKEEANFSLLWFMFAGNLTDAFKLRRNNRSIFNSLFVSKLADFLAEADENDFEELAELTGLTELKDLKRQITVPHNTKEPDEKSDDIEVLITSLRNAKSASRRQFVLLSHLFGDQLGEAVHLLNKEPHTFKVIMSGKLSDVLFKVDGNRLSEIGQLIGVDNVALRLVKSLGCYRAKTISVSIKRICNEEFF